MTSDASMGDIGVIKFASFIQLPLPLRANGGLCSSFQRYHYVKPLKAAELGAGEGGDTGAVDERLRTLLIANFDGTDADLRLVYGRYGAIERVDVGLSRIVALYHHSSTLYRIR